MNAQRFEKITFDEDSRIEEIRYMYHINDNYFVYASVFMDKTVYGVWNDISQENSGIMYEEFDFIDEPDIDWIFALKNPLPKYIENQVFERLRDLIAHYKDELAA